MPTLPSPPCAMMESEVTLTSNVPSPLSLASYRRSGLLSWYSAMMLIASSAVIAKLSVAGCGLMNGFGAGAGAGAGASSAGGAGATADAEGAASVMGGEGDGAGTGAVDADVSAAGVREGRGAAVGLLLAVALVLGAAVSALRSLFVQAVVESTRASVIMPIVV